MRPEPKPRSMAAVTITVNSKALYGSAFQGPLPNLAKCWNIWNVSPGARSSSRIPVLGDEQRQSAGRARQSAGKATLSLVRHRVHGW